MGLKLMQLIHLNIYLVNIVLKPYRFAFDKVFMIPLVNIPIYYALTSITTLTKI